MKTSPPTASRHAASSAAAHAPRGGPRSVARILKVLRELAEQPQARSLSDLSVATRTPKTSLLALMRGLAAEGYVEQNEAAYSLGQASFALGSAIVARRSASRVARAELERLAVACGETILIAGLSADRTLAVYTDVLEGTRAIRYVARVGETRPLHASASGRVLLAYQSAAFREAYMEGNALKPLNSRKKLTRAELRRLLDETRATGLCRTREEVTEGMAGFAAPIFTADGNVDSALLIGAPLTRGDRDGTLLSKLIRESAARISRALGYQPASNARA